MLLVTGYVITVKVLHQEIVNDMFHGLRADLRQGNWTVICGLALVSFLVQWSYKGSIPVVGHKGLENERECWGYDGSHLFQEAGRALVRVTSFVRV